MTQVIYLLADGTKVNSQAEALRSGQKYTLRCEPIKQPVQIRESVKAKRVPARMPKKVEV